MLLNIRHADGRTTTVTLDPAKTLKLGADKSCDVVLGGAGVLPVHCGIVWKQDRFQVVASKAAQTVEFNGAPVQAAVLRDADEFKLGDVTISASKPEEPEFGLAPMEDGKHKPAKESPAKPAQKTAAAAPPQGMKGAATPPLQPAHPAAGIPQPVEEEFSLAPLDHGKPDHGKPASPKPATPAAQGAKSSGAPAASPNASAPAAKTKSTPPKPADVTPSHPQPVEDEFALAPTDHGKAESPKLAEHAAKGATAKPTGSKPAPSATGSPATVSHSASSPLASPQPVEDEFGLAPMSGAHAEKEKPAAASPPDAKTPDSKRAGAKAKPTEPASRESAPSGKTGKASLSAAEKKPSAADTVSPGSSLTDLFDGDLQKATGESELLEPGAQRPAPSGPGSSAVLPVDSVGEGPAEADRSAPKRGQPRPPINWRRLKALLAMLVLVSAAAAGAWWYVTRPSADDVWLLAEQDFQAKAWTSAAQRYAAFVSGYPDHSRLPDARARLTLARLYPLIDGGAHSADTISRAKALLESSAVGEWSDSHRLELAELIGRLVAGAVGAAEVVVIQQTGNSQGSLDLGAEALALGQQYVPPALYDRTGLGKARLTLARLSRDALRPKRLADALAALQAAAGPEQANLALNSLRSEFSDLAQVPSVKTALDAWSAGAAAGVKFESSPPADKPRETLEPNAEIALGGANAAEAEGLPAFAVSAADGCAYAVDTSRGALLWRKFIGFETAFVPRLGSGEGGLDALLVDSRRQELQSLDARNGTLRWQAPLGARSADPVLVGDLAWCALKTGELRGVRLANGQTEARFILPQSLSVKPAIDAERGLIYQVADHSLLYILSIADKNCAEAVFLGHARGAVLAPPARSGHHLLIAENLPAGGAVLRAFRLDDAGKGPKQSQVVTLPGQVYTPLVLGAGFACVATSGGGVQVFSLDDTSADEPLKAVASRPATPGDGSCAWLSLMETQLWAAGEGLASFDLPPAAGALTSEQSLRMKGVFERAIVPLNQAAIGVHRPELGGGSIVSVWQPGQTAPREFYAGWPVGFSLSEDGEQIHMVHPAGAVSTLKLSDVKSGKLVLNQPVDGQPLADPWSPDTRSTRLPDGLIVLSSSGARRLRVWDSAKQEPTAKSLTLPGALACPAQQIGNHLALAIEGGPIYLLDPRSGAAVGEPFLPAARVTEPADWMLAVTEDPSGVVATDGQGKLYRMQWQGEPLALGKITAVDLESPLVAPPAVIGQSVWCATDAGLTRYALPDLSAPESASLPGRPIWGPHAVGGHILLALADDQLYAYGKGLTPEWQAPLADLRPVAATQRDGRLILAGERGEILSLDAAGGKQFWRVAVGQPLSGTLLASGPNILAVTLDGALLQISIPADEEP